MSKREHHYYVYIIASRSRVLYCGMTNSVARRTGAPKAITATAHKLARILFHFITTRQPYDESVFALADQQQQQRHERHLRKQAESMGFSLVRAEVQPA